MRIHFQFPASLQNIASLTDKASDALSAWKLSRREIVSAILILEEAAVKMVQNASEDAVLDVSLRRSMGKASIRLSCRGAAIRLDPVSAEETGALSEYGPEAEDTIRDMILKAYSDKLRLRHAKGINTAVITVSRSDKATLYATLLSMAVGIVVGFGCKLLLPPEISALAASMVFSNLYTLFLNAIKMIMAPLVFFSLASCIAGFTDLGALGRSGVKVMGMYMVTTLAAISLGFAFDHVLQPGDPQLMSTVQHMGGVDTGGMNVGSISLLDTVMGIVPSNFVGAFVNSNMLQIIFISIFVGVCAGSIGKYSVYLKAFLETMEALFSQLTTYIIKTMPIAVFASIAGMVISLDMKTGRSLFAWAGLEVLVLICMYLFYLLLLLLLGKINPIAFVKRTFSVTLTGFCTSSSNATMASALECCRSKLHIAPRLYSFSIPLGATINMDGASITYVTLVLFLARIAGVTISGSMIITLFVSVLLLSVATPGVPGATVACVSMLLSQLAIPEYTLNVALGLIPIMTALQTAINVTGDQVVTTIVARSEHAIDMSKW